MIYLNNFDTHTSYEEKLNVGGIDFKIPNVSYCKDVKDVHFNPYNLIKFYVGEITPSQTVKIYTDANNHLDVTVSEGNKWYSYLLPKGKGLYKIEGDSVKKVVVKADISFEGILSYPLPTIIPSSTIEASFKGSSKVTNLMGMFSYCSGLTSLDLSSFDTSNVNVFSIIFGGCISLSSLTLSNFDTSKATQMNGMFANCSSLTSIDLSSFDTSNVINMSNMFGDCSGLSSLTLSNFDTSNVTDMNHMFDGCTNLISLDISGWNTSKVNSISNMFKGCSNSLKIRMKGCSSETVGKIQTQLEADGITGAKITTK